MGLKHGLIRPINHICAARALGALNKERQCEWMFWPHISFLLSVLKASRRWWWMSFPKLQFCRQFMTREVYIPSCLLNSFIITGVQTALRSSSVFLMNRDRSRKRLLSHVERTVTKISKKGIPRQDPAKWSNFYSLALVYLNKQFINLSGDTTRHKETKIFTKKVFLMTEYQSNKG